jgi:PadR family transcriptional regulator PadR
MDPQLKRGLLEICVLSVLKNEDSYGYRMIKDLSGVIEISESTLYPILKRLEASGTLIVFTREHNGRLRKYYRITEAGTERIRSFLEEWKAVMDIYSFIAKEN